jgi:hypothetical protein
MGSKNFFSISNNKSKTNKKQHKKPRLLIHNGFFGCNKKGKNKKKKEKKSGPKRA